MIKHPSVLNIIHQIFKRVSPLLRRRWMFEPTLWRLWKYLLSNYEGQLRDMAVRQALALMYYYVPRDRRKQAVDEIIELLPYMQSWLKCHYLAGKETHSASEKRRKGAEKEWREKNG